MAQVTEKQYLAMIETGLNTQLAEHEKALPQGFNRDRFVLNSMAVISDMMKDNQKNKSLQGVDTNSIASCLAKGAFLGLDFFNNECYAIPYGGSIQFQTDYKGEIKLCKRYSKNPIKDIFAKVVREGDVFEEEITGGVQNIVFKPKPFSNAKVIGAFAIVAYKDGSMLYETMSKEEMENIRNTYSKAKNSPAWKDSTNEMYKKTVLRRLCKFIDLNFDTAEQMRAYEDGADATFDPKTIAANKRDEQPEPIDVFATVVDQPEPQQATEEFEQFEQQYQQTPPPSDGKTIEDADILQEELPFK